MQSFKTLYRDHYGFVWSTVRRHGVTPMLVEDAVHDTFVVAYRRLEAFDGRRPRAWLYSIGRRVASSYRRTQGRREARHRTARELSPTQPDLETTVGARTALERFLDSLSPADRELFVLSEIDGLTGPELAATLGRKLPTLYSRVRVLRQRFEQSVGGAVEEERPAANARGWMLLQPWLAAPATSGGSLVLAAAVVLGVMGVAAVGVAATRPPAPEPVASVPVPSIPPDLLNPEPPPAPPPTPEVAPATVAPVPVPVPVPRTPARPKPVEPAPAPAPTPTADDLAADTRMLREANTALRSGKPTLAKILLEQHEASFPKPAQPDLRTTIWIATLCALGRDAEAESRAKALLKARPGTPFGRRLEGTCVSELFAAKEP